jgi:hypothetical protein
MDPITSTTLLLMVTALVIVISGRQGVQTSIPTAPAPAFQQPQSGGGASGLLVILIVGIALLVLGH